MHLKLNNIAEKELWKTRRSKASISGEIFI
jgi:hypothetical protein